MSIPQSSVVTHPSTCTPIISSYLPIPPSLVATPPHIPSSVVTRPSLTFWMKHGYQLACGAVHMKTESLKTCTAGTSFFSIRIVLKVFVSCHLDGRLVKVSLFPRFLFRIRKKKITTILNLHTMHLISLF